MHNSGAARREIEYAHAFGSLKTESAIQNSASWIFLFILAMETREVFGWSMT
jgi:hypothetical protein